jgi:hypothetical protein
VRVEQSEDWRKAALRPCIVKKLMMSSDINSMGWLTRLIMRLAPGTKSEHMKKCPPSRADEEFLGYEALSSENFAVGPGNAHREPSRTAKSGVGRKSAPVPKDL